MATDTNTVVLCGRLVAGMETKFSQSGYAIGSFTIAVNRSRKNKDGKWEDKPSYIDCTLFGQSAKNLQQYLVKGKQVCLTGYLDQDRWDRDGQKFSRIKVGVTNIQLVGGLSALTQEGKPAAEEPQPEIIQEDNGDDGSFSEKIPF